MPERPLKFMLHHSLEARRQAFCQSTGSESAKLAAADKLMNYRAVFLVGNW